MTNILKHIWNIATTVLVVLIVLCAVFLMGSRLLGFRCYTVISGSMQPKYNVGDLLYVKEVNVDSIKVGDDITFILNENLMVATHRVVRVDAQNRRFYTKGLANKIEDGDPVHFNNVIGVPQFSIPKLGYVSDFVQNPPGMYIALGIGVVLVFIVFLPDIMGRKKKDKTNSEIVAVHTEVDAANEENERLKAEVERLKAQMGGQKPE